MRGCVAFLSWSAVCFCCAALSGCGTTTPACVGGTAVLPSTAVADHAAASPGNQVQFGEAAYSAQGTCPLPLIVVAGPVTTSDTVNVSVTTNGIATCLGPTVATISIPPGTTSAPVRTATLTCR